VKDHNCTNLQLWKEALLKVCLESAEECDLQNLVTSKTTRMQKVIDRAGEITRN
jgi:hypothetical protein